MTAFKMQLTRSFQNFFHNIRLLHIFLGVAYGEKYNTNAIGELNDIIWFVYQPGRLGL